MGFRGGMALEHGGAYFFCMDSGAQYAGPAALERLLEEVGAPPAAAAALVSLRPQRGETYMLDYFATGAEAAGALRELRAAEPRACRFFRWVDHRFAPAECPDDVAEACRLALDCALGCHAKLDPAA